MNLPELAGWLNLVVAAMMAIESISIWRTGQGRAEALSAVALAAISTCLILGSRISELAVLLLSGTAIAAVLASIAVRLRGRRSRGGIS